MQPQTTEQPKLIFGLSPKATLVNSIVLSIVSSLTWCIVFCQQIPSGTEFSKIKLIDNVPWYFDVPLSVLSVVLCLIWVEFRFKIPRGSWDLLHIRTKILALMALFFIQEISKIFFLLTILRLK